MEETKPLDYSKLERIAIDGMPFVPDIDVYIEFDSETKARDTALWFLAQGVKYMGFNEDRIYVSREDFIKIAKLMGYKGE